MAILMNNNINKTQSLPLKKQKGMSLVELLISMVVGLFLLAGVVTNFISTKASDVKRDAVSEMDANAAEAFRVLRASISHAGYRSFENTKLENDMAFYINNSVVPNATCRNGYTRDSWSPTANRRTRNGGGQDFITVISLADNPCAAGSTECLAGSGNENPDALVFSDCTGGGATRDAKTVSCSTDPVVGMPNPMDAKIYNSFWIKRNSISKENRTLYCGGSRGRPQPIVKDVETIRYLYGVKNDLGAVTFRNANQVTAADQWASVSSVQVGLLMRSSNPRVLDTPSTKTNYYVLGKKVTIPSSDYRRLFRIYTTTINLENRQRR